MSVFIANTKVWWISCTPVWNVLICNSSLYSLISFFGSSCCRFLHKGVCRTHCTSHTRKVKFRQVSLKLTFLMLAAGSSKYSLMGNTLFVSAVWCFSYFLIFTSRDSHGVWENSEGHGNSCTKRSIRKASIIIHSQKLKVWIASHTKYQLGGNGQLFESCHQELYMSSNPDDDSLSLS